MRTAVHVFTHTFYPEAEAEYTRLGDEEKRLTLALARRGDQAEPAKRRRASQPAEPVDDLDAQLAEVRAAIAAQLAIINSGRVRLIIKGLTRGEFRRLVVEHPAREGDEVDKAFGYNSDTFLDAFVSTSIVSATDLDGQPVKVLWQTWADDATKGQWEQLLKACNKLTNDGEPVFPR